MQDDAKLALFEQAPIPKAVTKLAVPTDTELTGNGFV